MFQASSGKLTKETEKVNLFDQSNIFQAVLFAFLCSFIELRLPYSSSSYKNYLKTAFHQNI